MKPPPSCPPLARARQQPGVPELDNSFPNAKAHLVLSIVLSNVPSLASTIEDISAMQLSCCAWREVLGRAATRSADISSRSLTTPAAAHSFSRWLSGHAGLVRSLTLDRQLWPKSPPYTPFTLATPQLQPQHTWSYADPDCFNNNSTSSSSSSSSSKQIPSEDNSQAAAEGYLHQALASAAASTALRLDSFSTNYLHSPGFLAALPSSLRQLRLTRLLGEPLGSPYNSNSSNSNNSFLHSSNSNGSNGSNRNSSDILSTDEAFTAALLRLTRLQALSVGSGRGSSSGSSGGGSGSNGSEDSLPPALLGALPQLPSLRHLTLSGASLSAEAAQQLPVALTGLVLQGCGVSEWLPLTHLSRLLVLDCVGPEEPQHAALEASAGAMATAQLPPCLTSLTLLMAKQHHSVLATSRLTNLQQLAILDSREPPLWLQTVAVLPAMKHLRLRYLCWTPIFAAAPCWRLLPTLQSLELVGISVRQHWQLDLLFDCIAAATTLTSLSVTHLFTRQSVKLCNAIKDLPKLASLSLEGVMLARGDPLAITHMSQLTHLRLVNCSLAVDDVAAAAICMRLTQLQGLVIVGQGLASMGVLYPISAGLKGLRALEVSGRSGCVVDEFALGLLSSLSHLSQLKLPGNPASLSAAVQGLKRVLPGLVATAKGGVTITPAVGSWCGSSGSISPGSSWGGGGASSPVAFCPTNSPAASAESF